MSPMQEKLSQYGIVLTSLPWDAQKIRDLNRRLDPFFEARKNSTEPQVSLNPEDLAQLGLLSEVFDPSLCNLLRASCQGAKIHRFVIYEIPAQQTRPHVFSWRLSGWHRDIVREQKPQYGEHISFFMYLTDVGPDDGPFEFVPQSYDTELQPRMKITRIMGAKGTAFLWNRYFFHRAGPNSGPTRRRVLKISMASSGNGEDDRITDVYQAFAQSIRQSHPEIAAFFSSGDPLLPATHSVEFRLPEFNGEITFQGRARFLYSLLSLFNFDGNIPGALIYERIRDIKNKIFKKPRRS